VPSVLLVSESQEEECVLKKLASGKGGGEELVRNERGGVVGEGQKQALPAEEVGFLH
jgi:hypothetical protein